jgi:7,8-dihydropterin-6-yl-methyl-4-(beta-D-ribofuranosyl)aminobenzene 5'-phosphate synthase
MEKLNISPREVDIVVLSHIHEDHVGGLKSFLEENPNVMIYVPESFPASFKKDVENFGAKVVEVHEPLKIFEGVYSTGELGTWIKEQSLIIQTDKGSIVITGCAHPGIVKIVEKAKEVVQDDIFLVMGGFHLGSESENAIKKIVLSFRELGVHFTAPCHCSGDLARQLFEEEYQEKFILAGVGKVIAMEDLK